MDSTLLQLFTAEEILGRLSEKESSGALHVFTSKESANLFFQEGLIVGAVKGLVEGEDVLKQVLAWSEPRFFWQSEVAPAAPLGKPMQLQFSEFLERLHAAPKLAIGGKKITDTSSTAATPLAPAPAPTPTPPAASDPEPAATPAPKVMVEPTKSTKFPILKPTRTTALSMGDTTRNMPDVMTSTKLIDTNSGARVSHEEALLKKYPLVLIGTEGETVTGQRLRLVQLSSLVGRNPACDFTIEHTSVSRQHCLLQITDRGLHVKDLGTTNGTKVNGITLTEGYINVGDTLSMGKLSFLLEKESPED